MIRATVTGTVWATRRLSEIPNGAFLEVRADGPDGTASAFVAFDVLGSGVGEEVLSSRAASPRRGSARATRPSTP